MGTIVSKEIRAFVMLSAVVLIALVLAGCGAPSKSSISATSASTAATTSSSESASAASSSSSSSAGSKSTSASEAAGTSTTSTNTTAPQGDPSVKTLLSKCAQNYYDIGDPLLDAIFSNNTARVQSYLDTVNSDLDKLNALADIPEEYQAGVGYMRDCLSKYSAALALYVEGSKYVNKNDAKADEYFDQADPIAAEAHDAYEAYVNATAGLIEAPTKRTPSGTNGSSTTGSTNSSSTNKTPSTTAKPSTTSPKKVTDEDLQSMLLANAQAVVRDHLKSPSSAKFPWAFSEYTFMDEGTSSKHSGYHTYSISGPVEAKNSYGTLIKGTFKVEIDYYKGSENYYEVSCSIK